MIIFPSHSFLFRSVRLLKRLLTRLFLVRSPSPPPQYDNFGRRVNTREYRYRKRLEDERHKLVEKAIKTIPNYHPPADYRRPTKTQEKVYVPVNDYPEINFSMITNPSTPSNHLLMRFFSAAVLFLFVFVMELGARGSVLSTRHNTPCILYSTIARVWPV